MNQQSAQKQVGLVWIISELERQLELAGQQLEAFFADTSNSLDDCLNHLYQTHGAAVVVQAHGADTLADELFLTVQALQQGKLGVDPVQAAGESQAETILFAVSQLHQMLRALADNQPIKQQSLLRALNGLRGLRQMPLYPESTLFGIEQPLQQQEIPSGGGNPALPELLIVQRPEYHKGLLTWYRDQDMQQGLQKLHGVFAQVKEAAHTTQLQQLMIAAQALTIALQQQAITVDEAIKQLFGQNDRLFKQLIEHGEEACMRAFPVDLLNKQLQLIAGLGLDDPDIQVAQHILDEQPKAPQSPGKPVLDAMQMALDTEVHKLEDMIDIYSRQPVDERRLTADINQGLQQITDALSLLKQTVLADRLRQFSTELLGQAASDQALSDKSLEQLADILTQVKYTAFGQTDDAQPKQLGDDSIKTSLHEMTVEMAAIKSDVLTYLMEPNAKDTLHTAIQKLQQVSGVLRVLQLTDAADCMDDLDIYLSSLHKDTREHPDAKQRDMLAAWISGLEYYIESVFEDLPHKNQSLKIAQQVAQEMVLPYSVDEIPVLSLEEPELPTEVSEDHVNDADILDIFLQEAREIHADAEQDFAQWNRDLNDKDALASLRRAFHTLKGSGRMVDEYEISELAWASENLLNRMISGAIKPDQEALGLVSEMLDSIAHLITARQQGENPLALAELSDRAFALADATAADADNTDDVPIAAPAAQVDPNPLEPNALEPGAIAPCEPKQNATRDVVATTLADSAIAQSPQDQAEQIDELIAQIHTLGASNGVVQTPSDTEPAIQMNGPAPEVMHSAKPILALDETLHAIFTKEANEHLDVIQRFSQQYQAESVPFNDLSYPLHTLHGGALSAGIEPMAELSGALENWVNQHIEQDRYTDKDSLDLINRSHYMLSALMDLINRPGLELPAWQPLRDEVIARSQNLLFAPPQQGAVQTEDDANLMTLFNEEAHELIESLEQQNATWLTAPKDMQPIEAMQRTLHTLKGSARMVEQQPMALLSHALESLFESIAAKHSTVDPVTHALVGEAMHHLANQLPAVRSPGTGLDEQTSELIAQLEETADLLRNSPAEFGAIDSVTKPAATSSQDEAAQQMDEQQALSPIPVIPLTAPTASTAIKTPRQEAVIMNASERIRVVAEQLDRMVDNAGELGLYRSRFETQHKSIGSNLDELGDTITRLQNQLRKLEMETEAEILSRHQHDPVNAADAKHFDPLELDRYSTLQQLSRALSETVDDLTNIGINLRDLNRDSDMLLSQQGRVTQALQEDLLRTRLMPFDSQSSRLQRLVRQLANELDKQVNFVIEGGENEVDRSILSRILAPMEHLLRNALTHGIEPAEERLRKNKPAQGQIRLSVSREAADMVLSVSDDGGGLNYAAIQQTAVQRGLLTDVADNVEPLQLQQLIFEPGFSTVREISPVAGRGVGMDVVLNEVKALGGDLEIESKPGQGTNITLRLPFTLAITDALLINAQEQIYAISYGGMEGVVRISHADMQKFQSGEREYFAYGEQRYRLHYLGELLDRQPPAAIKSQAWYPLLLVRVGDQAVAIQVDGLLGSRQIVVKSLGTQLNAIRWFNGGTILPDGRIALILDIASLVRLRSAQPALAASASASSQISAAESIEPQTEQGPIKVMVVDDSITVRKVTGQLLQRHGMQVTTARDGVEAVALLQQELPDLMLVDIEMPHMDGYELARHVRSSEELKHIPLIMITSRTGAKHRDYALNLGVKRYLGKPYQETELINSIHELLAESGVAV